MACCYLLFLFFLASSSTAKPHHSELETLMTIKRDWGSPFALSSWKTNNSISVAHCSWTGVTCNNKGKVNALSFQEFHIAQHIPASICNLKHLSFLDVSYNNLTGEFPTVLYGCSALQFLDLSNNEFTGSLPRDIYMLSSDIQHLNLSSNSFIGDVPSEIGSFSNLKSLLLDTNSLNGSYPAAAIGGLVELEMLTLASNPFMPAPIPEEFGKLKRMTYLWMSEMNLTGGIPHSLSALTELELLDMAQNKLQGTIPAWVWKLQKLEFLYLYGNIFTGKIGPVITAVNLLELDLSSNNLTGPIPEDIGNLRNLTLLFLYINNISGSIPASIGLLPNLVDIRLFNNKLSGSLPPDLGKHSPLGNLEVSNNLLSGELPETLCFNKKLYDIVVFNNIFSGVFPASIGECDTINNLMAQNNLFVGDFPEKIWSFTKLTTVTIWNNRFTGTLPRNVSSNMTRIEMGNNMFSGSVPASAAMLTVLRAENNQFSGELPADMTGLPNLKDLDLAGNRISGPIPGFIQAFTNLTYLNLSSNMISGAIPGGLGEQPLLAVLDLSNNSLSGTIPLEFNNLHLNFINLSFNRLTGEVPTSFQSWVYNQSFLGNSGLCSGPGSSLPSCVGSNHSKHYQRMVILLVVLPSITVISTAITGWLLWLRRNGRRDVTSWKMTAFRALDFTEHDIISQIREENVIGRGGSGKVYRIQLSGGMTVAVKKIGNAGKAEKNLEKEFESEVSTLGDLRHNNIIDLLCCISSDDTKLLVYENMENGSLDRWLHRHKRAAVLGPLDWSTRLNIAVDVARGLGYMHEGFGRPVIHRDVKCSNILLDCKFRAKIADFGLARILAKSGESESASGVCGTFGYIAPEYIYRAKVSEKVDVYSFGVVLLELATGRGAQDGGTESGSCLAKWASKRYKKDGICAELVDSEIVDPGYLDDMVAVFELGVLCTDEDPLSRPLMSEVLHRLLQCVQIDMSSSESKDVFAVDSSKCVV